MLRWSLLAVIVVVLLFLCGLVFLADGSWWNLVKHTGYGVVAIALFGWGLVALANHFKLTGESFHVPTWLDAIADAQPDGKVGPKANLMAMAIVLGAFILGVFHFAGAFLQP